MVDLKGYRKLAEGEVIRKGDLTPVVNSKKKEISLKELPHRLGLQIREKDWSTYRKARTDGCRPGWRLADPGEPREYVMYIRPYPEDPRLGALDQLTALSEEYGGYGELDED